MTDLTRARGDTYADEWQVKSETTGNPIDITGYTFLLTVDPEREPATNANNLFQITGSITDAANGIVEFAPSLAQSDQTPGQYFYDVQMIDGSSRKRTLDSGKYTFTQDITKD